MKFRYSKKKNRADPAIGISPVFSNSHAPIYACMNRVLIGHQYLFLSICPSISASDDCTCNPLVDARTDANEADACGADGE
jgi:hypothetical protein